MKKQLHLRGAASLFIGLSVSLTSLAQTNNTTFNTNSQKAKEKSAYENTNVRVNTLPVSNNSGSQSEAVVWSEDFASGFTGGTNGTWTSGGADAAFVTYDTDGPDNLIANGWGPLPSPTANNGFAIFDWYNNFSDPNGFATSPVEGTLTSPVMNLGTNTALQIEFFQQIYFCCGIDAEMLLEISTDGGTTFPNSIIVNDGFDRNERHWDLGFGYKFRYKIEDYIIADPTNVVIRFNWTSTVADANGQYSTAYFWMLDDIEITTVPVNSFEFTVALDGAPAHDAIFDGDGANSKHGLMAINQVTPISFDSNILNYGTATQENVKLHVDIFDAGTSNLVQALSSSATNVTMAEDSLVDYNIFATSMDWTAAAVGAYDFVFYVSSDSSIATNFETPRDTITGNVTTNLHSLDWNAFSNNIGTEELGDDGSAMANRLYFPNPNPDTTGFVYINSVDIRLSTQSTAGGDMVVEWYDTAFTQANGFSGPALASRTVTVTQAMVGSTATISFEDSLPNGQGGYVKFGTELVSGKPYYVVLNMFSNAGASPIQVANDQTFDQPGFASVMYITDQATWFGGFTDVLTFNAPWIRARFDATPPADVSINENKVFDFDVYPNPVTNGNFDVTISEGGSYSLDILNTAGQVVYTQKLSVNGTERNSVDVSSLAKGMYVVNLNSEKGTESTVIAIK